MKRILLFILIFSGTALAEENLPPLTIWPVKIQPVLSSSFAEYRPDHFHAGIDLKTWGKEGYRVYAVDDGSIVRIRTSPWFYGKAVYLKLSTGETAVYAHLSRFIPRLEEVIRKAQRREDTYEVDVHISEGEVSVHKGDVLAYTGSTGIGYPHLHFELRDKWNRPINPHKRGFNFHDTVPPVFQRVAFVPLDSYSLVNGLSVEGIEDFKADGSSGAFSIERTPILLGRIGIAVEIKDVTESAPNNLGIYRLSLFKNGTLIFEKQYEYFSYTDTRKINLDFNYPLLMNGAGVFHNLYPEQGNNLHFYRYADEGILIFQEEESDLQFISVEAEDFAGNVSRAEFFVRVGMPPVIRRFKPVDETEGDFLLDAEGYGIPLQYYRVDGSRDIGESWHTILEEPVGRFSLSKQFGIPQIDNPFIVRVSVNDSSGVASPFRYYYGEAPTDSLSPSFTVKPTFRGDLLIFRLHTDTGFHEAPLLKVKGTWGFHKSVAFQETGLGDYIAKAIIKGSAPKVWLEFPTGFTQQGRIFKSREYTYYRVQATDRTHIEDPSGVRIDCPPGSFYEDTYLGFNWLEQSDEYEGEIHPHSKILRIFPRDIPLAQRINLALRFTNSKIKDSISGNSGDTSHVKPESIGIYHFNSENSWTFVSSDNDGDFILGYSYNLGDYALFIDDTPPSITNFRPRGTITKKDPIISVSIKDEGSGINRDRDIRMWFDDYRIYAAYDPDRDLLAYQVRNRQKPGKHTIRVSVRDMQGNENKISWDFHIAEN